MKVENYINHIALVLDASGSMRRLANEVIKVADNQIAYLAQRSKELDQETRVTVYTFDDTVKCLIYDKDVLRMPSIKDLYKIGGNTALIDATLKSIEDLKATPELYGEHAFLIYVITDGEENRSGSSAATLKTRLENLKDNWTLAAFVPNATGIHEAKKFGFPKDNIAVWDATSAKGVENAGQVIREATERFMSMRSSGIRGYKNLFQLDVNNLNKQDVKKLKSLGPGQFRMLAVNADEPISSFVERQTQRPYKLGEAYYQLTKPVEVQSQKLVALYDKRAHTVYTGPEARDLIGLPKFGTVKVEPTAHPNYGIFIQSTSVNRKLFSGTSVLLIS